MREQDDKSSGRILENIWNGWLHDWEGIEASELGSPEKAFQWDKGDRFLEKNLRGEKGKMKGMFGFCF